jgi:hypothetical protein
MHELVGSLPLELFRIIQQFLSHRDYRQLMNTSCSLFTEIKYKTTYFNFICYVKDNSYDQNLEMNFVMVVF